MPVHVPVPAFHWLILLGVMACAGADLKVRFEEQQKKQEECVTGLTRSVGSVEPEIRLHQHQSVVRDERLMADSCPLLFCHSNLPPSEVLHRRAADSLTDNSGWSRQLTLNLALSTPKADSPRWLVYTAAAVTTPAPGKAKGRLLTKSGLLAGMKSGARQHPTGAPKSGAPPTLSLHLLAGWSIEILPFLHLKGLLCQGLWRLSPFMSARARSY
ncbi:hypothetical protein MHYP_G00154460 [Metynnis hypsauchen]